MLFSLMARNLIKTDPSHFGSARFSRATGPEEKELHIWFSSMQNAKAAGKSRTKLEQWIADNYAAPVSGQIGFMVLQVVLFMFQPSPSLRVARPRLEKRQVHPEDQKRPDDPQRGSVYRENGRLFGVLSLLKEVKVMCSRFFVGFLL